MPGYESARTPGIDRCGITGMCVNILVVSGPDRLSRNAKDIIAYAEFLQNFDVETYSPEQGKIEVLCTSVLKDSALAVPEDSPNLSIH